MLPLGDEGLVFCDGRGAIVEPAATTDDGPVVVRAAGGFVGALDVLFDRCIGPLLGDEHDFDTVSRFSNGTEVDCAGPPIVATLKRRLLLVHVHRLRTIGNEIDARRLPSGSTSSCRSPK